MTIDWTLMIPAEIRAAEAEREIRAAIRARRDTAIAAGTVVAGLPVATDDAAQQRLMGAVVAAMLDPGRPVQWKLASGRFVTLDPAQLFAMAQAVRAHVQACFDHEAGLLAALAAGTAVDPLAGWP